MLGGYGKEVEQYIQSAYLSNGNFVWEKYYLLKLTDEKLELIKEHIDIISDNGCPFIDGNNYESRHAGGFTPLDLRGTPLSIGRFRPAKDGEPYETEMVFIFYHQLDKSTTPTPIGFISCSIKGYLCLIKFECCNASYIYPISGGDRSRKTAYSSISIRKSDAKYKKPKERYLKYKIKASHLMQAFFIRYMHKHKVQTIYKNPVEEAIEYNRETGYLFYRDPNSEFIEESELKQLRIKELEMMKLTNKQYSIINVRDVITGSPQKTDNMDDETRDNDEYRELLHYMYGLTLYES